MNSQVSILKQGRLYKESLKFHSPLNHMNVLLKALNLQFATQELSSIFKLVIFSQSTPTLLHEMPIDWEFKSTAVNHLQILSCHLAILKGLA